MATLTTAARPARYLRVRTSTMVPLNRVSKRTEEATLLQAKREALEKFINTEPVSEWEYFWGGEPFSDDFEKIISEAKTQDRKWLAKKLYSERIKLKSSSLRAPEGLTDNPV
ncbi:MAG: hypothetical protein LBM98_10495 [Oscillospiraceae bacterium]|jgi:hypothetical protein|nr:hypothetical protein [Oscillospiraceae bacterium]